jgi:hypothetical protein
MSRFRKEWISLDRFNTKRSKDIRANNALPIVVFASKKARNNAKSLMVQHIGKILAKFRVVELEE